MIGDIFSLFANSVEQVAVKKTRRGVLTAETVYSVTLDAIVKRRDGMGKAIEVSENQTTQTTVHFKAEDKDFIEQGNFVQIDGRWRVIERWNDGKDFDRGESEFVRCWLGDEIEDAGDDPSWGDSI